MQMTGKTIVLGQKYRDRITKTEGVATARCEYQYGLVQICITPSRTPAGKLPKEVWANQFDCDHVDPHTLESN